MRTRSERTAPTTAATSWAAATTSWERRKHSMPWQLPSSDPRVLRVHGAAQQLGEEQRAHGSRRAVEDHVVTGEARRAWLGFKVGVRVGV